MKREQVLIAALNPTQLSHLGNVVNREIKRRSDPKFKAVRPASRSGQHAAAKKR